MRVVRKFGYSTKMQLLFVYLISMFLHCFVQTTNLQTNNRQNMEIKQTIRVVFWIFWQDNTIPQRFISGIRVCEILFHVTSACLEFFSKKLSRPLRHVCVWPKVVMENHTHTAAVHGKSQTLIQNNLYLLQNGFQLIVLAKLHLKQPAHSSLRLFPTRKIHIWNVAFIPIVWWTELKWKRKKRTPSMSSAALSELVTKTGL